MKEETIRVGIVGAGANTTLRHIPGMRAIAGVEIASVCNRRPESTERVARQFGIPQTYRDWKELVNAPDTDAIVIGTWPYLHCRVTLAAIAATKHVLCEARMAMNAREAHAMLDAARAKPHLVAQVVPSPMTLGVDRTIKRLIREGYLGQLCAIEVRDGDRFLDREAPLPWRQDAELSGFNTLSLGIWYEALLRWVSGATRVLAAGKIFVKMRKDESAQVRAVRIPEHLDVLGDMANGAQLHMQMSAATGLSGPAEVFLFGSDGTIRFSGDKLYGGRRNDTELREIPIPPEEKGGWRVEEEFVNVIRGREVVTHTTFEDGVKYMEFTEAAARSLATGRAVSLPLQ